MLTDARTLANARRALAIYTYKPGWRFTLDPAADGSFYRLTVERTEPDSRNPGAVVPLQSQRALSPEELAPDTLPRVLRHFLVDLEVHEMHEWLRCDGTLLHDPHEQS